MNIFSKKANIQADVNEDFTTGEPYWNQPEIPQLAPHWEIVEDKLIYRHKSTLARKINEAMRDIFLTKRSKLKPLAEGEELIYDPITAIPFIFKPLDDGFSLRLAWEDCETRIKAE